MGIFDIFTKRKKVTISPPRLEMSVYRVPQKERVCLPPEKEKVCPYCQKALENKPTRKIKCPHCEKFIYVRHGGLVTEEQKVKHDDLDLFRFTEDEYGTMQSKLQQKFGAIPSHSDIIWGIANHKIPKLLGQRAYSDLSDLYLTMAKHLHSRGKDFLEVLRSSYKMHLQYFLEGGGTEQKVKIWTCGAESLTCRLYSGKILSIKEAIAFMPIPRADCLNKNRKDFYLCGYEYESEWDQEYRERPK
jgi:hypothetical protein